MKSNTNFFIILAVTMLGYMLLNSYQCIYQYLVIKIFGKPIYDSLEFHLIVAILLTIFVYFIVSKYSNLKFSTFGLKEI